MKAPPRQPPRLEICILAGGLSARMGRDKSRIKLGGRTLLARVRELAKTDFQLTGYKNTRKGALLPRVRVLREDAVPRCGPLGGFVTALRKTKARAVLFLACDMPLVSPALLRRLFRASADGGCATFTAPAAHAGFPLLLPVKVLDVIERQISREEFSLQALAEKLHARRLLVSSHGEQLININTPEELARAEKFLIARQSVVGRPSRLPRSPLAVPAGILPPGRPKD